MTFLLIYVAVMLIFLNYVYANSIVYYKPLQYKDKTTGKMIDVHKLYEPFQTKDKINYFSFILRGLIIFPFRIIICLTPVACIVIHLRIARVFYKNSDTDINHRKKIEWIIKFWSWCALRASLINLKEQKVDSYEKIYKKYLGEDYDFTDQRYSIVTCNHLGLFDVIINMYLYGPGFIAKKDVQSYPLFGSVALALNCLFVDREKESARKEILDQIGNRQKNFYEGKSLSPLCLFPEGTTTSNRNILKFKKGAFYHLMPIKPQIIRIDQNSSFHLAVGVHNIFFHNLKFMCYLGADMYYLNLPVIRPTKFMFENYSHLGKEKWEIFAEVTRKIYCEVGGFTESNLGYRDVNQYYNSCLSGKYVPDDENKKNN